MTDNVTIVVGENPAQLLELALVLTRGGFAADTIVAADSSRASSYLLIRNGEEWDRGIDFLQTRHAELLKGVYVITSKLLDPEKIHIPFDLLRVWSAAAMSAALVYEDGAWRQRTG